MQSFLPQQRESFYSILLVANNAELLQSPEAKCQGTVRACAADIHVDEESDISEAPSVVTTK